VTDTDFGMGARSVYFLRSPVDSGTWTGRVLRKRLGMSDIRILLVDDEKCVRFALERLLVTHEGWAVVGTASNGKEAIGKAEDLKPDVVIMDITMPEMNGLEATPQIKRVTPETEVLLFSQHGSAGIVREAQDAGASGYLSKSRPDSIIAAVEAVAEHRTFFQGLDHAGQIS
jgi:DNA-binding NarL/FixJ family response regulator